MAAQKGIGELLVRENLIDVNQLEEARKDQKNSGGRLMTALVKKGFVKERDLAEFLGRQYNLPTVDLSAFEPQKEALKLVPKKVCEKHKIIPISLAGRNLVVAFADPSNIYVKDDLALLTRCKIEVVVASETAIEKALDKHYDSSSKMASIMSEMEESVENIEMDDADAETVDQEMEGQDGPIIKFVNAILTEAIKTRTSDIHIEPYEKRFRVRFRIDGTLHEKIQPPPGAAASIISRLKIMCKMDIAERRRPQDGRLKVRLKNGIDIDFRANCTPTLFGEKMVLRILDKSNLNGDITTIGFNDRDFKLFKDAIHMPQGMVLVTGPTGSGKTTTLYSAVNELNDPEQNISTAENPVEFNLDGVNQVQVNPDIGFTFADALRAFLRQDPEIIMLGEIRDYETAEIAFKAASTGHLVLSTLHTNDSASTITRLVEMGIPPYIVAESTSLVVAQRLIKKVCERCAEPHKVDENTLLQLGVKPEHLSEFQNLRKGGGCDTCNGTGLAGRSPIFEVMRITAAIKEAIFSSASPLKIKKIAVQDGMSSLRMSALERLKAGVTTVSEVINTSIADDFGDESGEEG